MEGVVNFIVYLYMVLLMGVAHIAARDLVYSLSVGVADGGSNPGPRYYSRVQSRTTVPLRSQSHSQSC